MVEKASVNQSSRFKAELEIHLFISMKKEFERSFLSTRVTSYVEVANNSLSKD